MLDTSNVSFNSAVEIGQLQWFRCSNKANQPLSITEATDIVHSNTRMRRKQISVVQFRLNAHFHVE